MAAPASVIIHGTDASGDLLDEPSNTPSVLVESLTFKFTRERIEYRNRNKAFRKLKYVNPLLVMSFAGFLTSAAASNNVGGAHVGTEVASLSNFAAERRGMDPAVGTLILEDPEDELTLEEDAKTKFNVLHAPFVVNA